MLSAFFCSSFADTRGVFSLVDYMEIKPQIPEKMRIRSVINELKEIPRQNGLEKTAALIDMLLRDPEIEAAQNATNHIIVQYLKYNDHGRAHAIITTRNALKILTLLKDHLQPNIVTSNVGSFDDAAAVVALAAFVHDLGNMVHREFHYGFSLIVANRIIWKYIRRIWRDESLEKKWLIYAHIANAIYSHDEEVFAYTVEGSVVKAADGCDMAAGRSRRPYSIGKIDIHSLSALSITEVDIKKGEQKPVRIEVNMIDGAGVFQVEEILLKKIRSGILADYIEIETFVNGKRIKLSKPSFVV